MPHQVHKRKFGRTTGHRRSLLRNLSLSILRYERVKTTEAKAKEIRRFVDEMINLGKDGSLAARRRALAWLPEPVIVEKVFGDLAARYPDRRSGYLRMVHLGRRVGDSAPLMLLELSPAEAKEKEKAKAEETAAKPRRRLSLRRGAATKSDEKKDAKKTEAKAEKGATKKRATKKPAKGAAT